jgi:hypothetical protein
MVAKKKTPSIDVSFDDLRPLFGLAHDDPTVTAVLERAGKVTWTKPDGGQRYAVAKQAGFDILVARPRDAKRGDPMRVHTMFLYREGCSKHKQFAHPPYGLSYRTRAEVLAAMPKPQLTWKIGEGEVAVDTKEVSHDRWIFDGLYVSAAYDQEENVRSIDVYVIEEE